jgi:2-polyprenyl-6-hydroxyphenyl methylase/3-demethylubiquinone-9 3-methyltransferase
MPTINNQIYDLPENSWWDEENHLYLLKAMVNPWRVPFYSQVLLESYPDGLSGIELLDIGCGGGYLTEEYARLGCQTSGIDISSASIAEAIQHASIEGLKINYQVGSATNLEFPENSFDVVSCCDVLEHIENWPAAIQEIARVLRPGGLFFFDTINRTLPSFVTMIFGLEIFPLTRIFEPRTHLWKMFIKPAELTHELSKNNLTVKKLSGGSMSVNPLMAAYLLYRYNRVGSSFSDLGKSLTLQISKDLSQNYLGYGQLEDLPAAEASSGQI